MLIKLNIASLYNTVPPTYKQINTWSGGMMTMKRNEQLVHIGINNNTNDPKCILQGCMMCDPVYDILKKTKLKEWRENNGFQAVGRTVELKGQHEEMWRVWWVWNCSVS